MENNFYGVQIMVISGWLTIRLFKDRNCAFNYMRFNYTQSKIEHGKVRVVKIIR